MAAYFRGFALGLLTLLGSGLVASIVGGVAFSVLFRAPIGPWAPADVGAVVGVAAGSLVVRGILGWLSPVRSMAGVLTPFVGVALLSLATGEGDPRSAIPLVPGLVAAWSLGVQLPHRRHRLR